AAPVAPSAPVAPAAPRGPAAPHVSRPEGERIAGLPPEAAIHPIARIFSPGALATPSGRVTPLPPEPAMREPTPLGRVSQLPAQPVVDDAMQRIAGADELTDADFGLADRDLSVMTNLPVGPGA